MVAKLVEKAATSAGAVRQGEGQVQPATQEKAEGLRVNPGGPGSWQSCECGRGERTILRPHQRPLSVVKRGRQTTTRVGKNNNKGGKKTTTGRTRTTTGRTKTTTGEKKQQQGGKTNNREGNNQQEDDRGGNGGGRNGVRGGKGVGKGRGGDGGERRGNGGREEGSVGKEEGHVARYAPYVDPSPLRLTSSSRNLLLSVFEGA